MKKLPIGIQNFESMRRDGYFYLDKTDKIFRLTSTGRYYFLSRPRRFGKSLLLSTIKASSSRDSPWTASPTTGHRGRFFTST